MSQFTKIADDVGNLRERVEIFSYSITRNTAGEELVTWALFATVWAKAEYNKTGSDEVEKQSQLTSQINLLLTIRYRSDLDTKMKVKFDGKYWDIRALLRDTRKQYMEIECEHFET